MRFSDALIFYTDFEVAEFHSSFKFKGALLVRGLNNGLDLSDIEPIRAAYIAKKRENAIFFIGRLTEKSDLKLLLKSLVDSQLENVKLFVVGSGTEHLKLKNYAVLLGISDRVFWYGEITNEIDISKIANRCKLFVYPGAVGLSLLHAMSYGLPCIIHSDRREHMPEFAAFVDGVTGIGYKRGCSSSLTVKICEALGDVGALEKWSRNCINTTEKTFNTEDMANRFSELVDHLEGI
jgi:glycosyltransferase involved in cell wall biosynthesis